MAADAQVCGGETTVIKSLSSNSDTDEQNVNCEKSNAKSGDYKVEDIIVDMMLNKLKLNPMAKEFVPSYSYNNLNNFVPVIKTLDANAKRGNSYNQGRRRMNNRAFKAQREDSIRRTVYVSDIDQNITEERLAALFSAYGQVVDCRVCGDPHSRLRFAFVEFADEYSARASLSLCGTILGFSPLKVLPSKTAILPVNPTFLPRSEDEREMCARTVYCTNIDKKVSQADVKNFFETRCGEVSRLRLLGDQVHSTRIAFVEFVMAESAILALDCCGQILGSQRIRVSPSKTPVRPRVPRPMMH
ncbi:polyadenylate-binding protein-interacting protein 9 [Lycium barbarum]|uniref:polyadenylate-binding protein-interacting protein 9 n=1 Tax=Lycium barbarum TaxID=112863 RepID=UPI00293F1C9A|nr:polyadenylate-binding protein-interacting protein 9 [Lycium barbarum]